MNGSYYNLIKHQQRFAALSFILALSVPFTITIRGAPYILAVIRQDILENAINRLNQIQSATICTDNISQTLASADSDHPGLAGKIYCNRGEEYSSIPATRIWAKTYDKYKVIINIDKDSNNLLYLYTNLNPEPGEWVNAVVVGKSNIIIKILSLLDTVWIVPSLYAGMTLLLGLFLLNNRSRLAAFGSELQKIQDLRFQLESMLEELPDLVVFRDALTGTTMANQSARNYFGSDVPEGINLQIDSGPYSQIRDIFETHHETHQKIWQEGAVLRREEDLVDLQGDIRVHDTIRTPLYLENTRSGFLFVARDIVELKQKENLLQLQNREIEALHQKQEADYLLMSYLLDPFQSNRCGDLRYQTKVFSRPFRKFNYKGKTGYLGGDLSVIEDVILYYNNELQNHIFFINADAMGKSMQGAGGALVLGATIRAYLTELSSNSARQIQPEDALRSLYETLQQVFLTFNGSMAISCVAGFIHKNSGELFFFNAEHPFPIIYRGGKAGFIGESVILRKVGFENPVEFYCHRYLLSPGDIFMVGSDGKDDIVIPQESGEPQINFDETLFLRSVEKAKGDPLALAQRIKETGSFMDDFSLLYINYKKMEGDYDNRIK